MAASTTEESDDGAVADADADTDATMVSVVPAGVVHAVIVWLKSCTGVAGMIWLRGSCIRAGRVMRCDAMGCHSDARG